MKYVSFSVRLPESTTLGECDRLLCNLDGVGLDVDPDGEVWISFAGDMQIEYNEDEKFERYPTITADIESWLIRRGYEYEKKEVEYPDNE